MSITREVINQVQAIPELQWGEIDTYRDVLPAAILGSAGTYLGWRFATDHKRSPRTDGGIAGADVVALEAATAENPKKLSHMRKIMAVGALSVALGAAAGESFEPTVEIETVNPNATTALIVDGSYSMRYPNDMEEGGTRLGAAFDGLYGSLDAAPDEANPAILLVTNETMPLAPAGVNDNELRRRLDTDDVINSDKAYLAPALEFAAGLQESGADSKLSQIIITDGTISDASETFATLAEAENRQTTIILTGTPEGEYNLSGVEGAEVSAPVNQSFMELNELETVEVIPATSASEIESVIEDTITNTSVETKQQRWEGFRYLVVGALTVAGLKQVIGKNKPLRRGKINWRKKES